MQLAVLLRNGKHYSTTASERATIRYALQCDTFAVNVTKTPIQIPIPQQSPELIDLGIFRPAITISGVIDNVGASTSTTSNVENMPVIAVTRKYWAGSTNPGNYSDSAQNYYIPYKNALEEAVYKWMASEDQQLELEVGDANFPRYNRAIDEDPNGTAVLASGTNTETGGGLYVEAIQSCRFQQDAAQEDRWSFQMQFVAKSRADVEFD